MNSAKDEITLALEENGYAEKDFSITISPAFGIQELHLMFSKEGIMHKVKFWENDSSKITISFVYIIGDNYYDSMIELDTDVLERISTLNKFMNGLIESFKEIEKHLTNKMEEKKAFIFSVYSFNREVYYDDSFSRSVIVFSLLSKNNKPHKKHECSYELSSTRRNLINVIYRDNHNESERVFSYNP